MGAGVCPGDISAFSILERIDVGETMPPASSMSSPPSAFSILERIDVGETRYLVAVVECCQGHFQYPRTDRRG